ncbi:MAG: uroporphyrinogen decarboxylase family protein [bacterium]|nr:uroporphyrinogen decarboxylase family protein [bacterium]
MTAKERIKKAFANNGEPDRVPVEPGLDFDTLTDLSGLDYWEYKEQGHNEFSSLISWCDRLGFDLYHYAAEIPEPNPPENVKVSTKSWEEKDIRIAETSVVTSLGQIYECRRYPRNNPEYSNKKFIKNIHADWPVFREYFGTGWRVHPRYFEEYASVGDRGVVGAVVHSPIDWWQEYRNGGIEQVIYDFYDTPREMEEIIEYYQHQSCGYLQELAKLNPKPDFVMIHGSNCSASVISPDIFKKYALPYIKEAATLLKNVGILSLFHVCGKSREWLDLVADTDLNVIDALEVPPAGNVDLAEVKRLYGGRLCLKGNVSAMIMVFGTRQQVRDEVKRCIDSAACGGGFMLGVGDSIGPKANIDNIEEMVKTAIEYGKL